MKAPLRAALLAAMACLPAAGRAATHEVTIEAMKFSPAELAVKPGDKVVWINKDLVPHTATARGLFDSRRIAAGKRWTWTATGHGKHDYVCVYHPGMAARIVVQ